MPRWGAVPYRRTVSKDRWRWERRGDDPRPPWERHGSGPRGRWESRRWDLNRKRHAGGLMVVSAVVQVLAARTASEDPDAIGYAILLAGPLALAWRYRFPVPVLAVTIASAVGFAKWVEDP